MSEAVFPQRRRCKKCARTLGADQAPVYFGMFCSVRCAGMADLATAPENAPRECRTQRDGVWVWKRRYRSEQEIPSRRRDDPSTSWYSCGHCGHLHLGHARMGEAETLRMLNSQEDLRDYLIKLRGHATIKQVAEVAGVRPIRLRELEEGIPHPENLVTLFKVLGVYRVRLGGSVLIR